MYNARLFLTALLWMRRPLSRAEADQKALKEDDKPASPNSLSDSAPVRAVPLAFGTCSGSRECFGVSCLSTADCRFPCSCVFGGTDGECSGSRDCFGVRCLQDHDCRFPCTCVKGLSGECSGSTQCFGTRCHSNSDCRFPCSCVFMPSGVCSGSPQCFGVRCHSNLDCPSPCSCIFS